MRRGLVLLALALVLPAVATPQTRDARRLKRTLEGSGHDLRIVAGEEGTLGHCSFCHTPHAVPPEDDVDSRWDRRLTERTHFGIYAQNSSDPSRIGDGTMTESLCLGCHDGVVAGNVLYERLGVHPAAFMEEGHPVGSVYDAALARRHGRLVEPADGRWVDLEEDLPLFDGRMDCATCHDPHNGAADPEGGFLRRRLSRISLCVECHF